MNHELSRSLASYVFGAPAPEERRELDAHLAGCPGCRDELASYAGLPGLLSRLELTEAAGATLLPPSSLRPSVLAVVESERASRTRQVTRWRLAAAAAAAAAALAGVLIVTATRQRRSPSDPWSRLPG
ncbi:MAG: anti-sigma factor family protein [Nocardioidaceae bacterium]